MNDPTTVDVKAQTVHMVRRAPLRRWYVTLDFGGVRKKLGVSRRVARWLQGNGQENRRAAKGGA